MTPFQHILSSLQPAWIAIQKWIRHTSAIVRPGPAAWQGASAGIFLIALVILVIDFVRDPAAPLWVRGVNLLKAGVFGFLLPVLGGHLAAWLIGLASRIPYTFRWRSVAAVLMMLDLVAVLSDKDKTLWIALLMITGILAGGGTFSLIKSRTSLNRLQRSLAAVWAAAGAIALILTLIWYAWPGPTAQNIPNAARQTGHPVQVVALPDPSQPGPYPVKTLTYGSGQDTFRPQYGKQAGWKSQTVDGSKLLGGSLGGISATLRRQVWGFGSDALPVNGLVWMPDDTGEALPYGPFPLVLLVHGNHSATEFSDPGYAYLGELLASRGFIFVSVDQNFLNGAFTNVFENMQNENDARGWLLLEHLRQWETWNTDPAHPMYGRVDMQQIAVGGHSRGGEAGAVAAAFNRLPHYPEDASLAFQYQFNIRAVIAIAPIDGQYMPADRATRLENINYLVIHGSHDTDVNSFDGLNQYERVQFSGEGDWFKSALYVYRANHGQFNTVWGDRDRSGFASGLINRGALLSAAEQQQIARVYLSAFLEAALHQQSGYRPLLQDARAAGDTWLPDTIYINRYDTSHDRLIAAFEEDINLQTPSLVGGKILTKNLDLWKEGGLPTRWGSGENSVVTLGWNEEGPAEYRIELPTAGLAIQPEDALIFALADAKQDPASASKREDPAMRQPVDFSLVLEDSAGHQAVVALSSRSMVQPQLTTQAWKAPFFTAQPASEPALQSYIFPLAEFSAANPALNLANLRAVSLVFDRTPRGSILLDAVGFRTGDSSIPYSTGLSKQTR